MAPLTSFSWALFLVRSGMPCRRRAWKTNKHLVYQPADGLRMGYLALMYSDGRQIPWIPVQCDMLEDDWEIVDDKRVPA
jgi:hypothetical protein